MSGMTKAQRLTEMKRLYIHRAWSDIELAEKLGTRRETIFRDRRELEAEGYPFVEIEHGRWKIDRTRLISEIKLNLHEALTLYLAARRVARQTRFHHPHAANAVEKLAATLRQPMTEKLLKAADRLLKQVESPEKIKILETIAQAWVEQRKVRIEYQALGNEELTRHTISPYIIEPSIWSDSVYVIAKSDFNDKIFAFKIERILSAFLSSETFEMPKSFDNDQLLKHAWGVWFADRMPVAVKLRFAPNPAVIQRLEESIWHPLERVERTADGGRIWSAQIAEPREMLPWIRGWGADVEVLEPEELRREIIKQVRDLAAQYKVFPSEVKPYMYFWAKADRKDPSKLHRLPYHLLDVGHTALRMWNKAIDAESKRQFCKWLNCDEETAGQTLAFLISLHDLGKASPVFQIQVEAAAREVAKVGFGFPKNKLSNPMAHGTVSAIALKELLQSELCLSKQDAMFLAQAVGGHHGVWIHPADWQTACPDNTGGAEWESARKELLQAMKGIFNPKTAFELPQDKKERNAFLTLFSGFASIADWIGSMTEHFPYEMSVNTPLQEYTARAVERADKALTTLGWFNCWQADGHALTFKELFPFIDTPNSVQQKIIEEVANISLPALLILEAPTGSGKTEAALYAADVWLQAQRGSGMYIAMPTQATSNQMYDRVTDFLRKRYKHQILNIHLVHGGALLKDTVQAENIYDKDKPDSQGEIRAETWFLPRKRTLLAPFGVGTVDQALMSVLQTRHFFVRMFGLQSKVVVFDEVHAYDTYMSELFKRLLQWLRLIGVSVILLSATLPEKTRHDFVTAYLGSEKVNLPYAEYPRLTIASGAGIKSIRLETPSSRKIQLQFCDTKSQTIIAHLQTALQDGGCAAVICNRVKRAQELYKEILVSGFAPEEVILFHARFPFAWREEIEQSVLDKFGKCKNDEPNPSRPKKSIVIATQVIEQSLDLDFDYMVTDLAPIDLLIQRAGRLHRHSQNDSARPQLLKTPTLLIAFPQAKDIPEFGNDEYVYERSVMLKTWLTLKDKSELTLPAETAALIESVYGEKIVIKDEALQKKLEEAIEIAAAHERNEIYQARTRLVCQPENDNLLNQRNNQLEEDDPTVHRAFRAMTRSADPGILLICLHRVNGAVCLDPEGIIPIDLSVKPDKDLTIKLLRQSVNAQNRAVMEYFSKDKSKPDTAWKEVAALKYAIPVVFENGRFLLDGSKYTLVLDRKLGLTLQKEEQ